MGEREGEGEGEGEGEDDVARLLYKKKSIFFDLKSWKHLLVRHQLYVMHIKKNVFVSICGILLHQPGKTKDGINPRKDLSPPEIREKINKAFITLVLMNKIKSHPLPHIL